MMSWRAPQHGPQLKAECIGKRQHLVELHGLLAGLQGADEALRDTGEVRGSAP